MDAAFGWIGQIFQALLKMIPALIVVPATHAGVAFVHGHRVKKWDAGLHWYWPIVTQYKTMAIVRQTQMIRSKVVMTRDLQTVIVGALVTYYVDDIVQALAAVADLPSDIMERSMEAILTEVSERTMQDAQSDRVAFNRSLTDRVSKTLNGYGVQVIQAQLTEFAPCRAFSLTGHTAVGNYTLWTGF